MKLHKSLLLFGASALILAACGDTGNTEDAETTEEPETEEVAEDAESGDEAEEVAEAETDESDSDDIEEDASEGEIAIGEPIEFETFTLTIADLSTTTDYDGEPMLMYTYDWENNGEDTESPFMTFDVTAFQNGVSTESSPFSEDVDYGSGQVDVRPEGVVEGAQGAVGLDNVEDPVELEVTETFSWDDTSYTTTINPADYQ